MGRRRHLPPFECEITHLGPRGVGLGVAPDGRAVQVRGAPPGARVALVPAGLRKGRWNGRRTAMVRPPADYAQPACAQFGVCGGCTLQELSLAAQRRAKHAAGRAEIEAAGTSLEGVVDHGVTGAPSGYGYRNKVELSFGTSRWLTEAQHADGLPIDGRFLGFHAPGRFDRVVDAPRCELISEAANAVLGAVRTVALDPASPRPYDARSHEGFWRHLLIREAGEGLLVVVYTAPSEDPDAAVWVARVAQALEGLVVGMQWRLNAGVADVARGEVEQSWGRPWLEEALGSVVLRVSPDTFFQTSTAGCVVLYDTIGAALGSGGTLLDLYCGGGAIGLYLSERFAQVVGVEEREAAVEDARANADRNGVTATYRAARVERALQEVRSGDDVHVVVDPPRAGLHPDVARAVAEAQVASLVYVACKPGSLGRDAVLLAQGGWRMTDLWTVDMFPQTGHVEMVARFER